MTAATATPWYPLGTTQTDRSNPQWARYRTEDGNGIIGRRVVSWAREQHRTTHAMRHLPLVS